MNHRQLLAVSIASLLSAASLHAQISYGFAEAKAQFDKTKIVAAGLDAQLFAAEPQVQNPTNIAVDHRGRVWATEAVNYRSSFKQWGILREEGDRVVILDDTNGDGVADKETTFWQSRDLTAPLGICVLPQEKGTKVIVSAAPNVWLISDNDGDDKADEQKLLFKVKGNFDHDHQVHAFVFGADGKFYFNFGNESRDLLDADGKYLTDLAGNRTVADGKPYRQGMIFRCDIDLATGKVTNLDTMAHNFRNNYEVCVDSLGTMWQSDNDDDGNKAVRINYVMEWGNYGFTDEITGAGWRTNRTNGETEIPKQHWHQNDPGSIPNLLQTGSGSPTGILVNEGNALGPQFKNQLIHCDAGPRTVRAYPVKPDGAGYTAEMVDILTSEDKWYRPADVAIAPDGALFVADWYDPGVGGHNMGDHDKGKVRGRIYRVAAPGAKASAPKVDVSTAAGAAAALASPNETVRYMAWTALHKMGAKAEGELTKLWQSSESRVRARALALLAQISGKELAWLRRGLSDKDADIRVASVRLISLLNRTAGLDTQPLEDDKALVGALIKDSSPAVRRQIALTLYKTKKIAPLWTALAMQHDGKDRWYLEALGLGAVGNEEECFNTWLAAVGDKWNTPAGRDIIWRSRTTKAGEYQAKLAAENGPDALRYVRALDFVPAGVERSKAVAQLAGLGSKAEAISTEALKRLKGLDLAAHPEVKAALDAMLAAAKGTPKFIQLVRDFGIKGQSPALIEVIAKNPAAAEAIEAVKFLAQSEPAALAAAFKESQAAKLIEALGNTASQEANNVLKPIIDGTGYAADVQASAVRALARSQSGVRSLLKRAQEGRLAEPLKAVAAQALAVVQMPEFKADIAKFFPLPASAGGAALPPIAELAKMKGDAARGKTVFENPAMTCITCHVAGGKGLNFGPGLSEIGGKLAREAMFESIIAPNAGVSMGFETTQVTLKNGDTALGIISSDTPLETVLSMPGGVQNRYARDTIAKREKLPHSMMPTGLQAMMSTQDLVDLVEYLSSLKPAKK